ncbi:hypothetical protein SPOG_03824 [Schizosaccharomyces cryophilus OY26]|uniref:Short chain dehydrogenase n=1 Tax=Schizosaccharomyces cryophilus (strain OY26 / ATCC MYA-4695 / CBS 11777 / NBRC 106824 / NRRL Y48691) TaxID=653667 RepID=S9W425_SCHCR|nr:uncharacterized protein SPOG_03824 [Schizosaccharomyces cryophilus OY26]EPY53294.1 hypothetical protein SPOG_03824 [Schizosaccharomyces cryophilus OY26]
MDATEQLVKKIKGFGTSADAIKIQANLRDVSSAKHIVDATVQVFVSIVHNLANNAGEGDIGSFTKTFYVNVRAAYIMTEKIAPYFPKIGGRIINVGSIAGREGLPQQSLYNASNLRLKVSQGAGLAS